MSDRQTNGATERQTDRDAASLWNNCFWKDGINAQHIFLLEWWMLPLPGSTSLYRAGERRDDSRCDVTWCVCVCVCVAIEGGGISKACQLGC